MKVADKIEILEGLAKKANQRLLEVEKNQKGIVVNIEETARIEAILTLAETVKILADQLTGTNIILKDIYVSGSQGNGLTIQTTPYTKEKQ
jgi:F0F1-type ATP synthase alpha subunit